MPRYDPQTKILGLRNKILRIKNKLNRTGKYTGIHPGTSEKWPPVTEEEVKVCKEDISKAKAKIRALGGKVD